MEDELQHRTLFFNLHKEDKMNVYYRIAIAQRKAAQIQICYSTSDLRERELHFPNVDADIDMNTLESYRVAYQQWLA